MAKASTGRRNMENVGVRELKDRLSHHLRTVRQGESVVVTIRGKPVARLVLFHTTNLDFLTLRQRQFARHVRR
jgi:antitoxin (DNA-binding transcriptional repressor) of toxin-antitoxin stability system